MWLVNSWGCLTVKLLYISNDSFICLYILQIFSFNRIWGLQSWKEHNLRTIMCIQVYSGIFSSWKPWMFPQRHSKCWKEHNLRNIMYLQVYSGIFSIWKPWMFLQGHSKCTLEQFCNITFKWGFFIAKLVFFYEEGAFLLSWTGSLINFLYMTMREK